MGGDVGGAIGGAVSGLLSGGPVGFFAGAAEGYSSSRAQRQAKKAQKEQQAYQQKIIDQQNEQALQARKNQINRMREQIGAGGNYSTRKTSEKGIRGYISDDTLG